MGNDETAEIGIDESDLAQERQELFLIQSETLSKRFESRRINFYSCISRKVAREQLAQLISRFQKEGSVTRIGFADSVTLHQLGVFEMVDGMQGIEVINPFERYPDGKYVAFGEQPPGRLELPPKEYYALTEKVIEQMRESLMADIFITGANAVTMRGQIVSTDGTGNRVAGMIFGPRKVIIVVGVNKLVRDVEEAIKRNRNVAAPLNFIRHNRKHHTRFDTPCLHLGYCADCNHPGRPCLNTVIIDGATAVNRDRMHLLLVNDNLGL